MKTKKFKAEEIIKKEKKELEKYYINLKLCEELIDFILTYQTSQNYSFMQLSEKSLDELYEIKKEVG